MSNYLFEVSLTNKKNVSKTEPKNQLWPFNVLCTITIICLELFRISTILRFKLEAKLFALLIQNYLRIEL